MIFAKVAVAGDGQALELVPNRISTAELERRLRDAHPSLRGRRIGGRVRIDFAASERLLREKCPGLEWSAAASRHVLNRHGVRQAAPSVLDRVAELRSSGPPTARSVIGNSELAATLDDHQTINVAVMTVPDGWGACIFDEQGTGKTLAVVTAFDVLVERNEADVLLVVSPKSMVSEWAAEFARFTGDLYSVAVADGSRREKARALHRGADVIVINYEGAVGISEDLRLLCSRSRVLLAVDESYNVKNPEAARTTAISGLRELCTRCFVLCGTPAPNSSRDLISQFDLVDFGLTFDGLPPITDDVAELNEPMRAAMATRGVFTRNLKQTVLTELPERGFTEVEVELAPEQRRLYDVALGDLVTDLEGATDTEYRKRIGSFLQRRTSLLRICSNPSPVVSGYDELPAKLIALDELLPTYLDAGEKVLLWSFYRASLDALAQRYARYGLVRIDGSVSENSARRDAIQRFQEDDDVRLFLGNPAAAGAGLTLHRSRVAIYESMSNQAAHFMQSLDRIHRRGQEREVEYVILLARDTLERAEYQRLLDKTDAQADLLGDPAPVRPTRQMLIEQLRVSHQSVPIR